MLSYSLRVNREARLYCPEVAAHAMVDALPLFLVADAIVSELDFQASVSTQYLLLVFVLEVDEVAIAHHLQEPMSLGSLASPRHKTHVKSDLDSRLAGSVNMFMGKPVCFF